MKTSKLTTLIIEDEESIRNFISSILEVNNYKTISCSSGKEAISLAQSYCPDLILLDLGLPDIDGIDILKNLRQWSLVPIIIISARHQETEKVLALDNGADDYITKPFGTKELLARIRTALRHKATANLTSPTAKYYAKNLSIDFDKRYIALGENEIKLTPIEYKLVSLLAQNSGKVLTYEFILKTLWGPYVDMDNQILRVNMANIRRKIEQNPAVPTYIFTEVGIGYRMLESELLNI